MDTILTVSSQGQITIPKNIRQNLGAVTGLRLLARLVKNITGYSLLLEPQPRSWAKSLAGTGRSLWGKNSQKYLTQARNTW